MSLSFLRGLLRNILSTAQESLTIARKNRNTAMATLKEIYAMSQTTDNLTAAVEAVVSKLEDLATENTSLKAQVATYAALADKADALEAAAVADAAAEKDATDKLNAALASAAGPAATTAELDAAATP